MKDKAKLIVGGVVIVADVAAVALIAIFRPESLGSIYMVLLAAAILGYLIAIS